MELKDENAI